MMGGDVYSGYEQTIMKQLAVAFPEYANRLLALCDRTFDLLKLVQENYYHPEFHGSYSIKSVLPALVPGMSYGDLEIQHGSMARWRVTAASKATPWERMKLVKSVLGS